MIVFGLAPVKSSSNMCYLHSMRAQWEVIPVRQPLTAELNVCFIGKA
jgi:hypothetical protein